MQIHLTGQAAAWADLSPRLLHEPFPARHTLDGLPRVASAPSVVVVRTQPWMHTLLNHARPHPPLQHCTWPCRRVGPSPPAARVASGTRARTAPPSGRPGAPGRSTAACRETARGETGGEGAGAQQPAGRQHGVRREGRGPEHSSLRGDNTG